MLVCRVCENQDQAKFNHFQTTNCGVCGAYDIVEVEPVNVVEAETSQATATLERETIDPGPKYEVWVVDDCEHPLEGVLEVRAGKAEPQAIANTASLLSMLDELPHRGGILITIPAKRLKEDSF